RSLVAASFPQAESMNITASSATRGGSSLPMGWRSPTAAIPVNWHLTDACGALPSSSVLSQQPQSRKTKRVVTNALPISSSARIQAKGAHPMLTALDAKHTIVVGGGLAGLTAATYLARAGQRVTVL